MNKDNLSSLYNALISKGYSTEDLGDEKTFRSKMSDKGNRKALYDYVSGRGDFRIGNYESYENRLSSSFARPSSAATDDETGSISRQVIDEYDKSVAAGGGDPTARMLQLMDEAGGIPEKQPSLKEMVKGSRLKENNTVLPVLSGYSDNVRSEERDYTPVRVEPVKYNPNANEDKEIERQYTPKDVVDEGDILLNYENRFGLTERGMELQNELADIRAEVASRYIEEFKKTPEYRSIAGGNHLTKEEKENADRQINELFQQKYGGLISNDMKPYEEAYRQEMFNRYGFNINEDIRGLGKKNTKEQVEELSSGIDDLLDKKHKELKKRSGSGNNAFNAMMGSASYNSATARQRQEIGALESARRLLDESQEIMEEAGKKGKTTFAGGLVRGVRDKFDPENWLLSLAEMADSKYLLTALEKSEKGEELTEAEEKLLEASVVNMATQAYFSSDLGRGYKAGQMFAGTIPMIIEFGLLPVASAGNAVARSLLRFGMKRFGKGAMKKGVSRFATRLLGDAAAAAGMTAATGIPRIVSGTEDRLIGNFDYRFDDDGNLKVDKVGDVGFGEALARSAGSTFFENQSEMIFNPFRGWNPFMKVAEKAFPGGMDGLMRRVSNSKPGQFYKELKGNPAFRELARRTQFNGLPEEYLEEVYNNLANVAMGEMSVEEALNLDNNIDTFLGLVPVSAAFGLFGTGSMAAERASNRRRMKRLSETFTDEQKAKFEELRRLSKEEGNKDIREFIKLTMADGSLTPEEKRNEIEYAYELVRSNAMEEMSQEQDAVEKSADDAYVEGSESSNGQRYSFGKEYDAAERALRESNPVLFESVRTMMDEGASISGIRERLGASVDESEWNMVSDYYNQKSRLDGAVDAVEAGIDESVSVFSSNLEPAVVTLEDGTQTVTTAMYKDSPVYVTADDGTNATIMQDGGKKLVPSKELSDVRTSGKDDIINSYREQLLASGQADLEKSINHHPQTRTPEPGMLIWNGDTEMLVSSVEQDGTVHAFPAGFDNRTGQMVPNQGAGEIVMSSDEAMKLQDDYYERLSGPASSVLPESGTVKLLGDGRKAVQTGISNDGQEVSFDIVGRDGNVVDSDAMPVSDYMSLSGYVPENGDAVPVSERPQESINMSENKTGNENSSLGGYGKMSDNAVSASSSAASVPSPEIPVDDKGNLLYHKAPLETTMADLQDGTLNDEELDGFIAANQKEAVSELKAISGKAPKIGTNKARYIADRNAWQKKVDEAQSKVDYWDQVKDAVKESRIQPGDRTAEEILAMGEPLDGYELAAQMLASGKLPLLREDYMRETGFGGLEASGLFGLFKSESGGGMTLEKAGEKLMLADMEAGTGFFDQSDANAGRNAILEVLSSVRKRGDLINYIANNRKVMADRERIAEQEYDETLREAWAQDNFGMSYADYMTYEEVIYDIIKEKEIPEDVLIDFYNNFADEINNFYNGRVAKEASVNDRQGNSSGSEDGEGVLPSEQTDNNRGTERDTTPEIDGRADNKGVSAQESTPSDSIDADDGGTSVTGDIAEERKKVDVNPTDAQKDAGNYRKGHVRIDGFDITIENPKGSGRSGTDAGGNRWSVTMNNDYGYIRGTEGVDGDHIDVFLSDTPSLGNVYIVDQIDTETGKFDEHKVMYGFASMDEATSAYLSNYSPGWQGLGAISEISKEEFKRWISSSHRKTKPFVEYRSVKVSSVDDSNLDRMQGQTDREDGELPIQTSQEPTGNESDAIRFREVEEKDGNKSLVGLHNISEDKLRKALRLGGLANPSAAVIDISKQTHEGYGEISLVLPSSMIDKRTGRNAGTWSQDAWTPVYPTIERQFGENGGDRASEDIMSVPEEMQNETRKGINAWMDGRSGRQLSYLYLQEQGKAPELVRVEAKYPEKLHREVKSIMGDNSSLSELDNGKRMALLDLYIGEEFSGDQKAYKTSIQEKIQRMEEKIKKQNNPKSLVVRRAQEDLDSLLERGYDYRQLSDFVENVLKDAKYAGSVNDSATSLKAEEYITDNGLQKDFDRWLDGLNDRYEVKEVIFDGFTPSGERKYIPNTLENVSRFMKKEGANAATGLSTSFNRFAAGLLNAHGSLKDIRKEKDKLTSEHSDVDAFRDKWSDVFYDLGMKLQPDAQGYDDYGLARLMEAAQSNNPQKYIRDEYGIEFSDADAARLQEMIDAIRNEYPAMYFETKFERPVYLNEFAAAVVPESISQDMKEAMERAGLEVFVYHDGDEASRNGAVKKASEIEGVRFRKGKSPEPFSSASQQAQQEITGQELSNDTKVVEDFGNSVTEWDNIARTMADLSEKLNTPVRLVRAMDELPDGLARRALENGRNVKGWYDTGTGEVVVYLPNAIDANDAKATFLHEVVAHKGLRELLGKENYDSMMENLYGILPKDVQDEVRKHADERYSGSISVAMDEYLAEQAEKAETPSWWDRVISAIRDLLRKAGIAVELSGNDVKYLLWRSRKRLERGDAFSQAEDVVMRRRLYVGESSAAASAKGENIRFREGAALQADPESTIRSLNARIRSLEKTVEKYENTEELRRGVTEFIRRELGNDLVSFLNKEDLNSLLMQAQNAKTSKSLERIVMNVKTVVLNAQRRKLQRIVDKLLSLQVQDVNGKNMSIAKNVDDSTRRIFSFMKGRVSDLKLSGFEDDMTWLRRDTRNRREEIARLEKVLPDVREEEERSRIEARIADIQKDVEANRERISELKKESDLIKEQVAAAGDIDISAEMDRLNGKMDEAAMGKAAWTQGDSERMAALNIIQGVITGRRYDSQIADIEIEKQKTVLNNSSLYKERVKEPDWNKRRLINEQINENRRKLVSYDRLIGDARSMQVKQMEMVVEELNELVSNGKNSLLRKVEEEASRKKALIGGAIRSVQGKPIDIFDDKAKKENAVKKFFSAPMGSFEYMCKRVNTQTLGKDGFLYRRFIEGSEGVMKAYDTYVLGMKDLKDRLNAKTGEIFGKDFAGISSLSDKVIENSGVYVFQSEGDEGYGVKYQKPLSKGQAMYIYQVWKMPDGRTKLELQGFDEESVAQIVDFIGPEYVSFADWVQEEFLKELREKYNEKYVAMYNTSMADIENYIPLKIRKDAIRQETSLSDDGRKRKTLEEKAGSLINRTFNTNKVDITCSGFDVLWEHGNQMEEWNAYARVRRDLDYILSSTTFRLQLNANVRGSYENFYDAAEVAAKAHHPDAPKYGDEVLGKLSKGLVGGNIAYRMSTALKQVLSAPAFLGYSQHPSYLKSLAESAIRPGNSFKWCMENIPSFYERVSSGTLGNEKLDEKSLSKLLDKYIEIGMIPNKMVDAITCAVGASSIYDYKYSRLKKSGLSEEEARNQALVEADIYYNATQQSSHPAFLSPMQMSRTFTDRMLTTYQNSNIGYVRRVLAAFYDLTRSLKWNELKRKYIDMYVQDGMSKKDAESKAYGRLLNENRKNVAEIVLFGWGLNLLWELGSQGLSLLFDDDDSDSMWTRGISFFLTSPVKGLPGGNLIESIASGYGMNPFLVYDELEKFMKEVKYAVNEYGLISPEIAYITLSKASRYAGVDLEVWGNVYLGMEGMCRDGGFVDDGLVNTMYMLNFPKSNRAGVARWLYKDEPVEVFAEKVARASKYIRKDNPLESWVPGSKSLSGRKEREFEKQYERIHMTDEERRLDDEMKIASKVRRKLKELEDDEAALESYIENHKEEYEIYERYY